MTATADDHLSPGDRARLEEAVRRLRREGLIWREAEADRRAYNVLARRRELAAAQLQAEGWELIHHPQIQAFQIVHRQAARRRKLERGTATCLLVARLLYAERRPAFTRYPVLSVDDIAERCAAFQPAALEAVDLAEALPALQALKLLRPAGGPRRALRPGDGRHLVELLPTLEIAVPEEAIALLAGRLSRS